MNSQKLIVGIGFVSYLSLVAESKTTSTIVTRSDKTVLLGKNVRAKNGLAYSYPTPILEGNLMRRYVQSRLHRKKEYYWSYHPILAFGVDNFLSYAAHFCKHESENGTLEVVSVGSGRGNIENEIIEVYANLFGEELRITLVEKDPALITPATPTEANMTSEPTAPVDFPTVDDLIAERANVVGNCVLFIIWPWGTYDIEAIRKLRPRAVLTMYEMKGTSGSLEFRACLNPPGDVDYVDGKKCSPKLSNYIIEEIAYQKVIHYFGGESGYSHKLGYRFRLVKLKQKKIDPRMTTHSAVRTVL